MKKKKKKGGRKDINKLGKLGREKNGEQGEGEG